MRSSPDPAITDQCVKIARMFLTALQIPIECDIQFYTENSLGILGRYDPGEKVAKVKYSTNIPQMVNTVAHEVTHDFLMSNSTVGKELIKYHTTYKLLNTGEFLPENPHRANTMLFMMSRYVNEGFATFIGDLVLQMFAEDYKNHVFSSDNVKKEDLLAVIRNFEELSNTSQSRTFDYYYGKMDFNRVASIFGIQNAIKTAFIAMDVRYECRLEDAYSYHEKMLSEIYDIPKNPGQFIDTPKLRVTAPYFLMQSPHLRLIALSRLLPPHDDFEGVLRTFDPEFLEGVVSKIEYPERYVKLGYILGEFGKTCDFSLISGVFLPPKIKNELIFMAREDKRLLDQRIRAFASSNPKILLGLKLSELAASRGLQTQNILQDLHNLGVEEAYDVIQYADFKDMRQFSEEIIEKYDY